VSARKRRGRTRMLKLAGTLEHRGVRSWEMRGSVLRKLVRKGWVRVFRVRWGTTLSSHGVIRRTWARTTDKLGRS